MARRIKRARELKDHLDVIYQGGEADPALLQMLQGEINEFSISTVCDKRELVWRRHLVNYKLIGILRVFLAYLHDLIR